MADVKISQLPTGTPTGASLIPIVENGVTSQTTPSALVSVATSSLKAGNGDYTLAPEDVGQVVVSNVGTPATFTLTDSSGFPVGGVIEVVQEAAGQLTLAEGAATTIKRSRFANLELGGEGSTVRLRKQSAGTWIASGDLKETQPRAAFTLEIQGPTGSAGDLLDLEGVAGQEGAPAAWQFESNGTATCLIGGLYQFSGVVYILYTNTSSNQNGVLGFTKNGLVIRDFARGVRESSSNGIVIAIAFYGWEKFAKGDIFRVYAPEAGTRINTDLPRRQFWATRISD